MYWDSNLFIKYIINILQNVISCSQKIRALAYHSLVRPHLEYCASVWDPQTKSSTNRLEMVQSQVRAATLTQHQ